MSKQKFIIVDWANNICFKGKTFPSFEDAWGFIREKFDHLPEKEFDEEMGEYSVVPDGARRDSRYLDPNDPRAREVAV